MTFEQDFQRAVYQTIKADAQIMALVDEVYDRVQRDGDSGKPISAVWGDNLTYIEFGATDAFPDDVECADGAVYTMQVNVWSRQVGRMHCKGVVGLLRRLFHNSDLTLDDYPVGSTRTILTQILDDPDGLTTHGVVQLEIKMEY